MRNFVSRALFDSATAPWPLRLPLVKTSAKIATAWQALRKKPAFKSEKVNSWLLSSLTYSANNYLESVDITQAIAGTDWRNMKTILYSTGTAWTWCLHCLWRVFAALMICAIYVVSDEYVTLLCEQRKRVVQETHKDPRDPTATVHKRVATNT